jgi:dihydroorotate dehydrogenase (NAD+) catalytic subunit
MPPAQRQSLFSKLLYKSAVTSEIFRLDFAWAGPAPKAGQFFMVKPARSSVFLARPISAAFWEPAAGGGDSPVAGFLAAVRGRGTVELLNMGTGEAAELTGPLGNSWAEFLPPLDNPKNIALIGGGVGIAPLLAFVRELSSPAAVEFRPRVVDFYAGFKTAFLNDEKADEKTKARFFGPVLRDPNKLIIATEDGSEGFKGRIPDFLEPEKYAAVYACGPEAMLRAVAARCKQAGVPCRVSLERRMACGAGPVWAVPWKPAAETNAAATTVRSFPRRSFSLSEREPQKNAAAPEEPDLSVNIAGVGFRNPVIAASGTFGYGREYAGLLDIAGLGGICTKGLTFNARPGNRGIRLHETPSGLLNSIGLENPGIPAFIEKELPALKKLGPVVIANLSGSDIAEYARGAALLDASTIDMIELNISCPNVKAGGMQFGLDPDAAAEVTAAVRKAAPRKPLLVKLSPNAPDLAAVARACVNAGAGGLSLVNTFKAMAIDIWRRRPVFDNTSAGLSGPAIRPIALRMVWELWESLRQPGPALPVPIVGMGGIASAEDALEFLKAGAAAVQVGSATFAHPPAMNEISAGIKKYMKENNIPGIGALAIRQLP